MGGPDETAGGDGVRSFAATLSQYDANPIPVLICVTSTLERGGTLRCNLVKLMQLLQILLSGLATGAIYALVAVVFMLQWQSSQTINFSQGEFVMLPPFFVLAAMKFGGLPFGLLLLVGLLASLLVLGVLFKFLLVDPLLKHGVLPLV